MRLIRKRVFILIALCQIIFVSPVFATYYFADHFDTQDDYVGTDGNPSTNLPNTDYGTYDDYAYWYKDNLFVNNDDAKSGTKSLNIAWGQGMQEAALTSIDASSINEYYAGFWFRHDLWDWGSDTTYKWFRPGRSGDDDDTNLNFDPNFRIFIKGNYFRSTSAYFNTSDTGWHSVIVHMKHNTGSNFDGQFELWWDGVEVAFERYLQYNPDWDIADLDNIKWADGHSNWDNTNRVSWGFQSRPGWGSGNKSYFDDIVIASSKAEVETFLGEAGNGLPIVTVNATDSTASEAGPTTGTFQLSCDSCENLAVTFTMSGSATNGTDYTEITSPQTIVANGTPKVITVTPTDDSEPENMETVVLTITDIATYNVGGTGNATVNITDDDGQSSILDEDWEDNNFDNFDDDMVQDELTIQTSEVHGGARALMYQYRNGDSDTGYATGWFGDNKYVSEASFTDVNLIFWFKLESGFTFGTYGLHTFILACMEDWSAYPGTTNTWARYYMTITPSHDGEFIIELNDKNHDGSANNYTTYEQNQGSPVECNYGSWDKIRVRVKLNTSGQADGIFQMWINDVKKMEYTNVNIRGSYTTYTLNSLMISSYVTNGAPQDQQAFLDDIYFPELPADGNGNGNGNGGSVMNLGSGGTVTPGSGGTLTIETP